MKISRFPFGQASLVLSLSVLVTACNPEEYYPILEEISGEDAFCYQAKDLHSCQQLVDKCQPAFTISEDDKKEPVFELCVANPDTYPDDGSTTGGSTGGSTTGGSTGGSTTGGSTDGSTTGGSTGGSTTGGSTDGSDPITEVPVEKSPIEDAYLNKCQNLDAKYFWERKEIQKSVVISSMKKVKICHMTGHGAHTIVIACPALKAHVSHHDDYLGSCQL